MVVCDRNSIDVQLKATRAKKEMGPRIFAGKRGPSGYAAGQAAAHAKASETGKVRLQKG